MRKSKIDALFEQAVYEATKEKSKTLEIEEMELNKEPIPEEVRARFMRELDKVYPVKARKKRMQNSIRILRIAIAIVCVVIAMILMVGLIYWLVN